MQTPQGLLCNARAAWPHFDVEDHAFTAHLAKFTTSNVDELYVSDLYLACACILRNPAALQTFESIHMSSASMALAHLRIGKSIAIDDAKQRVRELLLVGTHDRGPLLANYSGRGSLHGFVRTIAVRTALEMARREAKYVPATDEFLLGLATIDPEVHQLKKRYEIEFTIAFGEAVRQLTARQRNFLRQYYLDGLKLEELAQMYRLDASTVSRLLKDTRQAIADNVRRSLKDKLQLSTSELRSVECLVSQLEISLDQLLVTGAEKD